MSYLNKQQREQQILEVAKKIALNEGLNTLTVRKIAIAAEISVGQVHHHFNSISELKAQAFLDLAYQNIAEIHQIEDSDVIANLMQVFGLEDNNIPYIRLWNSAESMSLNDPIMKAAYKKALFHWHSVVCEWLQRSQHSLKKTDIEGMAWRLTAVCYGFENLYNLGFHDLDFYNLQIKTAIQEIIGH
ncbi:TetR family transcriptional regulator [Acinetobacter rudis]|uniref:TetR family transcriptional regulator n=1 Tax=Acinetobacter rudis TaxID=632955 RepID=A0AAW8J617_9GAMM|nr:TetR family transcriptional regulator [Acinetobacter rudis]MDQ8934882.1 TetR family transcriptional regulator [Acinetobacter rudis]MDQ8953096.1 TetR family transcriptional regulator [Acinetobacter rudis]MDQ9017283.1 TetR family transcriptional regulator [Acinetobacter rudis]